MKHVAFQVHATTSGSTEPHAVLLDGGIARSAPFQGLAAVFLGLAAMGTGLVVAGQISDPHLTLVASALGGFIGVLGAAAAFGFRPFGKVVAFLLLAYVIRLVLGLAHYLIVMDPSYFQHPGSYEYLSDYQWMHESMAFVSDTWSTYGLGALPEDYKAWNKNATMNAYSATVYYFGGVHVLHIAAWNSFHALIAALLLGAAASNIGYSHAVVRNAIKLAAVFPFGLISSVMWRDNVGLAWIALGVYGLSATRGYWVMLGASPIAGLLAGAHRVIYAPVTALASLAFLLWSAAGAFRTNLFRLYALMAIGLTTVIVGAALMGDEFTVVENVVRNQSVEEKLAGWPLRIVRALFGPFPWSQVLAKPDGYEYMVPDFVLACANLAIILAAARTALKLSRMTGRLEPIYAIGGAYFLCATLSFGVHIGYVAIGVFFMIPAAVQDMGLLTRAFRWSIGFFFLANLIYVSLGLEGLGLIQGITGY